MSYLDWILGNAVGVMVPEDISSEDRSLFEDILGSLTDFRRQVNL